MCKNLTQTGLNFEISIKNSDKAVTALRNYGLTEADAVELITKESYIAIKEYQLKMEKAISPELIEIFGIQHTSDLLTYIYSSLKEFEINWELYKSVLTILLDIFHIEEIAAFPEKTKIFLTSLQNEARFRQREECGKSSVNDDEPPHPDYIYKVLDELKEADIATILCMCEDSVDENEEDEIETQYN